MRQRWSTNAGWICEAPAKINLALHVTGERADGRHLLESLVVFCDHGDRITAIADADLAPGAVALEASGPFAGMLGEAQNNLACLAAERVLAMAGTSPRFGVRLHLEKNLPIAAGIGGGSADGAAAMLATARLMGLSRDTDFAGIAETLGADVPMCLHSRPLVAEGIGERITLLADFPALDLLLVNPGRPVSTGEVFGRLTQKSNPSLPPVPPATDIAGVADWLSQARNDLETPAIALEPAVGEVLAALADQPGSLVTRMSGSGATCFALFTDRMGCELAQNALQSLHPDWWCVATRTISAPEDFRNRPWQA